ncbi:MAG: CinA-like protein [Pseudobdellovibrio sp.]|jgi:PncC family amidohydrolase|nr:CinA-like protein [Pseudobdellovibrio sp.]
MKEQTLKTHTENETELRRQVVSIVSVLGDKGLTVGFAESCTGGLLSSYFTELSGVSKVFFGSIISYDNSVKHKFLNVSEEALKTKGAVSAEVAQQMAKSAQTGLGVSLSVAVTGIAGPTGGTPTKPVGTVFIAVAGLKSEVQVFEHHFSGDRKSVQLQTCIEAVKHLSEFLTRS